MRHSSKNAIPTKPQRQPAIAQNFHIKKRGGEKKERERERKGKREKRARERVKKKKRERRERFQWWRRWCWYAFQQTNHKAPMGPSRQGRERRGGRRRGARSEGKKMRKEEEGRKRKRSHAKVKEGNVGKQRWAAKREERSRRY